MLGLSSDSLDMQIKALDRLALKVARTLKITVQQTVNLKELRDLILREYLNPRRAAWKVAWYHSAAAAYPHESRVWSASTLEVWRFDLAHALAQRLQVQYGPLYGPLGANDRYLGRLQMPLEFIPEEALSEWGDLLWRDDLRGFAVRLACAEPLLITPSQAGLHAEALGRTGENYSVRMVTGVESTGPQQLTPRQWADRRDEIALLALRGWLALPYMPDPSPVRPVTLAEYLARLGLPLNPAAS